MNGITIYLNEADRVDGVRVEATEDVLGADGVVIAPSITAAFINIGELMLCTSVEQAEQLRDQLTAALAEHDRTTAAATV